MEDGVWNLSFFGSRKLL